MSKINDLTKDNLTARTSLTAPAAALVALTGVVTAVITTLTVTTTNATSVNTVNLKATGLATYANDTAAKAANLTEGTFYKNADGRVAVVLPAA